MKTKEKLQLLISYEEKEELKEKHLRQSDQIFKG